MKRLTGIRHACAAAGLLLTLGSVAAGQPRAREAASLNRTVAPAVGPSPRLSVPPRTHSHLADGAELTVSERHTLPLVTFDMEFIGGADQYERADRAGLARFTAAMLLEGTASRTGDQLSDELQRYGTELEIGIGGESGRIGFTTTREKLEPVLKIMADVLLHPSFPPEALERLRARTLVGLQQARDRTAGIAQRVFPRELYGDAHPYGWSMTEKSAAAITRDDVVAFHRTYFRPGAAVITVVGDVNPQSVRSTIESALAEWPAGGNRPTFSYPPVPPLKPTTIYLADKPGAEQSTLYAGLPGPPRSTPDYFALELMNRILGGMFQSRLNANLREEKGYTYGAGSAFAFGHGPGPFRAGCDLVTDKTDAGLVELMRELRGVRGEIPFTDAEIRTAKASLIQSLPGTFETTSRTAAALAALVVQGLPEDYYETYEGKINAVTREDLLRVARRYVDLDHLAIVIVGDRSKIEAKLRATKIAPVLLVDADGSPLAAVSLR